MESVFIQLGGTGSGQINVGSKPQNKCQKDKALLIHSNCGMLPKFTSIRVSYTI